MGCFLGCFGGEKDHKRRKQRTNPHVQRNRVQNVNQETINTAEQTITETTPNNLVAELRNKPEEEEELSASPRKRVAFNPNITTYEHVLVKESIDSLPFGREDQEELKSTSPLRTLSEVDGSVISSVGSYPPNHRYHNARDCDDEYEVYGDSDLDGFDDDGEDDEDEYDGCNDHTDYETVLTASKESKTENTAENAINEEVKMLGSKAYARDRCFSVLNPIENITHWKDEKSKGMRPWRSQEKLTANFEAARVSFSSEAKSRQASSGLKSKSNQVRNENQEIGVDASLSSWMVSPEIMIQKTTVSQDSTSVKDYEDRPILGALTVDELRQISATSSPRKSPRQSPDEMPIIGTVGTYWNHSTSETLSDSASSYRGLPNTVHKYREVCGE